MLKLLSVQNYALIEALQLRPSKGLSVITGETGAGKSILLGALNLLLGHRNQRGNILLHEDTKCVIEGVFDVSNYELSAFFESEDVDYEQKTILRRELLPGAKSRSFVNDAPVSLEFVRRLGEQLIDIHSQHDILLLTRSNFQRSTLDAWAENQHLLHSYRRFLSAYQLARSTYTQRKEAWEKLQSEQDYLKYQLKELQEAQLQPQEQSELEDRLKWVEAHQQRSEAYGEAIALLQEQKPSILLQMAHLVNALEALSLTDSEMRALLQRVESARLELKDVSEAIEKHHQEEQISTEKSNHIEERLNLIYQLQKKHQLQSCEALLALQSELEQRLKGLDQEEEALEESFQLLQSSETELREVAEELSRSRRAAVDPFSEAVISHLKGLGMPYARFSVSMSTSSSFQQDGIDQIQFTFSANAGIAPQPLVQVASGGEKSRLMFVIKYLLGAKQSLPTLIFDEIDTGISGETAQRMIDMAQHISQRHQVILISHLPQFAARAETHFLIYKEESKGNTVSNIRVLSESDRIKVLAEMLDGQDPSPQALENAKNMRSR